MGEEKTQKVQKEKALPKRNSKDELTSFTFEKEGTHVSAREKEFEKSKKLKSNLTL